MKTAVLLDARRSVSSKATCIGTHKFLGGQLTKRPRNGRKQWWMEKCKEMEKAATIRSSRNLYGLTGNSGRVGGLKNPTALIHSAGALGRTT